MQIHSLVPGLHIQALIAEVHALHGAAAKQTPYASTTYRAVVKDSTGLCSLMYQPSPRCNPAVIRRGNCYTIRGTSGGTRLCSCIVRPAIQDLTLWALVTAVFEHTSALRCFTVDCAFLCVYTLTCVLCASTLSYRRSSSVRSWPPCD